MDSIFFDGEARAIFLRHTVQSFGCTYICLWSYFPEPSNSCLIFMDGFYKEENINQPSSSSGSIAQRLFNEYRQSIFTVENDRVPGHAFKNNLPFVVLKELDLRRLASVEAQLQFYQEARIKTAIFMGCKAGEIEFGMRNDIHQVNLETEIRSWFPEDFPPQELPLLVLGDLISLPTDQNWPSPSSSSLLSASMDGSEYSPFSFNTPITSKEEDPTEKHQALRPKSTSICPLHQAMQAFSPTNETEDAAITKAIIAVPSSASSLSSSSHDQNQQNNVTPNYPITQKASAFERYISALPLPPSIKARARRQSMLKRAIAFSTSLSLTQAQIQRRQPTITQAHFHRIISERKRREKLSESIRALIALLPPGTKKDKVSVLNCTTKYMTSLQAQVEKLTRRNQILEEQVLTTKEETTEKEIASSEERVEVQVTDVAESTSEATIIDLQVIVRGEFNMLDLMILIMDFLKEVENVGLMSVKADSQVAETSSTNRVKLRLKIEGGEWDKSSFQEAARRAVADIAQGLIGHASST